MSLHNNQNIARIENRFIFNAQYKLSPREQKLILFLIANMDPQKQKRFHEQTVTIREFEKMLKAVLTNFGVKAGIVFKQLLPKVTSSEFQGFEDWYFEEVLAIFKKKGKRGVGAFVKWFLKHKIFEQGDHFATVMEKVQARKKVMQLGEDGEAWENRMLAKGMTAGAFREQVRQ